MKASAAVDTQKIGERKLLVIDVSGVTLEAKLAPGILDLSASVDSPMGVSSHLEIGTGGSKFRNYVCGL